MMLEREMIVEPFSVRVETRAPRDAPDILPDDAATDGLMDLLKIQRRRLVRPRLVGCHRHHPRQRPP